MSKWVVDIHGDIEGDYEIVKKYEEPKIGHWINYDNEYLNAGRFTPVTHSIRECSECHTKIADFCGEMRYCPNCGAKMEMLNES